MYCHDLEVMCSNPSWVEHGVRSTCVPLTKSTKVFGMSHMLQVDTCMLLVFFSLKCYCFRGIWNVPYVAKAILFHGFRVQELQGGYVQGDVDADMALAKTCREKVR